MVVLICCLCCSSLFYHCLNIYSLSQVLEKAVESNNKAVESNTAIANKKLFESQKIREALVMNSQRTFGGSGYNNAPAPPVTSIQFDQDDVSEFTEDRWFDSDGASNTTGSFHTAPESIAAASAKSEDATFLSAKEKEDCTTSDIASYKTGTVKSDKSPTPPPASSKKTTVDGTVESDKSPTPSKTVGTVESDKSPTPSKNVNVDGIVDSDKSTSPSPDAKRQLFKQQKSVRFLDGDENKNNNDTSSPGSPKKASVVKSALKRSTLTTPAKAKKGPVVAGTSIKKTAVTPTTKKAPVVAPHTCPGRTDEPEQPEKTPRRSMRTKHTPNMLTYE